MFEIVFDAKTLLVILFQAYTTRVGMGAMPTEQLNVCFSFLIDATGSNLD